MQKNYEINYQTVRRNTVHEFLNDVALPDSNGVMKLTWSLQPFKWLYALYRRWLEVELHQSTIISIKYFRNEVVEWAIYHGDIWDVVTTDVHRKTDEMEEYEPLIELYSVDSWKQSPSPSGTGYVSASLVRKYSNALVRK